MANINDKRAEVIRRQRDVGKKISRLKSNWGVNLDDTGLDPRKSRDVIARLNSRQLEAQLTRLNQFQSRQTQFVGDSQGRPIAKTKFREYQKLVDKYNANVRKRYSKYDDIFLKSAGQTVKERRAMTKPVHRAASNPASNSPVEIAERRPQNIASPKALDKLIRDMKRKTEPNYHAKRIRKARKELRDMARGANAPEIHDMVKGLTDEQFDFLWNETNFANALSLVYELNQSTLSSKEKPWFANVIHTQLKESMVMIDDARKVI